MWRVKQTSVTGSAEKAKMMIWPFAFHGSRNLHFFLPGAGGGSLRQVIVSPSSPNSCGSLCNAAFRPYILRYSGGLLAMSFKKFKRQGVFRIPAFSQVAKHLRENSRGSSSSFIIKRTPSAALLLQENSTAALLLLENFHGCSSSSRELPRCHRPTCFVCRRPDGRTATATSFVRNIMMAVVASLRPIARSPMCATS